jgi:hypothetical protein
MVCRIVGVIELQKRKARGTTTRGGRRQDIKFIEKAKFLFSSFTGERRERDTLENSKS